MSDIRTVLSSSDEYVEPVTSPNTLTKIQCKVFIGFRFTVEFPKTTLRKAVTSDGGNLM